MFRVFSCLVSLIILCFQIFIQSDIFNGTNSALITLASYFPYGNAYWFTILQTVPLIFLAGTFLGRERKVDSLDTIYYRPESNADYVIGMMMGFVKVFMAMAGILLLLGMLLHVLTSDSPLHVELYFFYWLTLIFPTLVFITGFSFFVYTCLSHRGLSILLLLVVCALLLFQAGDFREGLFDPFGLSLPSAFSEVSGYPNLMDYLTQRTCWFFVGLGFAGLSVFMFHRLPNHTVSRKKMVVVAVGCLMVGMLFGIGLYLKQDEFQRVRDGYAETYNKYRKHPKGNVITHLIEVEQKGRKLYGKSTLLIRNQNEEKLPEILLYLNPTLKVTLVKEGDVEIAFKREDQAILLERELEPREEINLTVEYEGGVDERVCYLDVKKDRLYQRQSITGHGSAPGKRFVFLEDDFTALVPECLWYPVAQPPVNPASPYDVVPEFTRYTLQVTTTDDRVVVAPGVRESKGNVVCFTGSMPWVGMALCMGNFEKYEVVVDSLSYELFLLKGHKELMRGFEEVQDSMPSILRDVRYNVEGEMGITYPYKQLILVESPISFASFVRPHKGGSEMAQPGMLFLPERGVGLWNDYQATYTFLKKMMPDVPFSYTSWEELKSSDLTNILSRLFLQEATYDVSQIKLWLNALISPSSSSVEGMITKMENPYSILPMFYEQTIALRAEKYPAISTILVDALKSSNTFFVFSPETNLSERFAGHNVEDIFHDRLEDPDKAAALLHEKSRELLRWVSVNDVSTKEMIDFLVKFVQRNRFRQMEFEEMNREFIHEFGVDWMDVLPTWYEEREVPVFYVKDFKQQLVTDTENNDDGSSSVSGEMVMDMENKRTRASVCVFNDSKIDGIVSFEVNNMMYSGGNSRRQERKSESVITRNFLIKAGTGKQIAVVMNGMNVVFKTNVSNNIPTSFFAQGSFSTTTDTTEYVKEMARSYFMPSKDEMIVDNEDEGFRLNTSSSRKRLRGLFSSFKEEKYETTGSSLMLRKGVEIVPKHMVNPEAYGSNKLTDAFMMSGGKAEMEWKEQIEREGVYEIWAYIPPKVLTHRVNEQRIGGMRSGYYSVSYSSVAESDRHEELNQYYFVNYGDEKQEVVIDVKEQPGWFSLGFFELPVGECNVVLTNRGEKDQVLLGDAIKWVYQGDK